MKRQLTAEQAYQKIRHYCGYSERSHYEVREKLYSFGLPRKDVETLLTRLIEEDFLNEERYAVLFAGGHFRQKKWGKTKIIYALRQKKISEQNIKRALREIDQEEYLSTLKKLASVKWEALKGEQYLVREARTSAFLQQKGYEIPAIQQVIKLLKSGS